MSLMKNSYIAAAASVLLLGAFVLHVLQMPAAKGYVLIAITLLTGLPIALQALRSLRVKAFSIELLVAISLVGATVIGEYVEAAVLGFLFIVGAWLETRALRKIRSSLQRYMEALQQNTPDPELAALIADRVEEAQESPTARQQFLQRFANIYTPAVAVLAILVYLYSGHIDQALTFLVIACPGALVISVPAALAAGISNGAHRGILIKNGYALEALAAVDAVVFTEKSLLNSPQAELIVERLRCSGLKKVCVAPGNDVAAVNQLKAQGYKVAVVGDPDDAALALADVSVVLGAAGVKAADTADILILADQADQFLPAYGLARATLLTMKQNTWFALTTVGVLLAGVSLGQLFLAWGMLIHEVSVLMVILNAARLIRYKGGSKLFTSETGLGCRPVA